jgi:hypothetical protein
MATPIHMSLQDRKAYALQAAYYGVARKVAAGTLESDLQVVSENVLKFSKNAVNDKLSEGMPRDLDKFLAGVTSKIEQLTRIECEETGIPAAAEFVLNAIRQRAEGIKCHNCYNGIICTGGVDDDVIVAAQEGGECIREIRQAFDLAVDLSQQSYEGVTNFRLPRIVLGTTGLTSAPSEIPGQNLGVNATSRFDDEMEEKTTYVDVRVAPLALNQASFAALRYLLMHEVFCHGFQMVTYLTSRPKKKSITDPVSEGMMDALAVEVLRQHALGLAAAGAEKVASCGAKFAARDVKVAELLHSSRSSLDLSPRFPEAPQVNLGVSALESIRALYALDSSTEQADADVFALACHLNLAEWDYAARFQGLSRLSEGLGVPPRDTSLIRLLLEFRAKRDVREIINHLTNI